MKSAEIVKALREDCKTCSENSVCGNGVNLAGLYCANKDAADLIERLEKEKAELLEYVKKSTKCEQCANNRPQCNAVDCFLCVGDCPCKKCKHGSRWQWKGLEDNDELPR